MKFKPASLIAFQAFLFVLFLFVTAWFNHFSADDYYCIGEIRNHSLIETYNKLYLKWTWRWTFYPVILFLMQFNHYQYFLFITSIISFSMLFCSIYSLFHTINIRYKTQYSRLVLTTYSIIFSGVFFFFTHATAQSWYWISASLAYLWSSIFFIWGLSCWLKETHRFSDYMIMIVSCIYIGGSNEVLALAIILLLSVLLFVVKKRIIVVIPFLTTILSFSIYYFGPGTAFRDEITPSLPLLDLVLYVGYGTINYLILDGYKTILPAIIFAFPFYLLGKNSSVDFGKEFQLKKELLKTLLFIGVVVVFNQFIVIYALGGLAPDRATITSSLLGSLAIVRFMFLYGKLSRNTPKSYSLILPTTVALMLVFNVVFFVIHYNYSKSVKERLSYIEANKNQEVIVLKKLAESGYLNSAEISVDSSHFLNQHLKSGLELKGQLVLKEN